MMHLIAACSGFTLLSTESNDRTNIVSFHTERSLKLVIMAAAPARYRGRFAPTPSGPLHLGSLLTALASYLEARTHQGEWLLRIDDIDTTRVVPAATAQIQAQLEAHALHWDGTVRRQSEQLPLYATALNTLAETLGTYACECSRRELQEHALPGPWGPVYPGTCGRASARATADVATRLRVPDRHVTFVDLWQGTQRAQLQQDIGDFVLRRRDGVFGYQLCCAVDELSMDISDVVRGADLLGSTFQQLLIMQALGGVPPRYAHLNVLTDAYGRKLSKQNHANALDVAAASDNLLRCLRWLGQSPPASLRSASPRGVVEWALAHWRGPRRDPASPLQLAPL